ncbi:hypothetical protein C5N14_12725 [Micromonospora sp. MW-13]|uniref:effector-associated constant component EACC1 n=1 Tax=unclassified Micromonospora TaxID=2617518 RepID=UPI000E431352|nr:MULTISPECIES: hypothetical protein [unclassified Micromonospora]MCX4469433.1 hypothetical protein [Micromonospora sp. NBC_01655]RGC68628.1 hypothetical protein C5N14_12725 [Micromonospora sp. MW-13]
MYAQISVVGGDEADLSSLFDWLRLEDGLRGRLTFVPVPAGPDEMGAAWDVLSVALASGGTLSVLAGSLAVWFQQPRRPNIKIEISVSQDDTRIVVDATNVKNVEQILRQVSSLSSAPAEPRGPSLAALPDQPAQ